MKKEDGIKRHVCTDWIGENIFTGALSIDSAETLYQCAHTFKVDVQVVFDFDLNLRQQFNIISNAMFCNFFCACVDDCIAYHTHRDYAPLNVWHFVIIFFPCSF